MTSDLGKLAEAELRYAYFNAFRTAAPKQSDSISLTSVAGVVCLVDANRPTSLYYNRAVIPHDASSLASILQRIPASVQAIELLAPQQTELIHSELSEAGFSVAYDLSYMIARPAHDETLSQKVNHLNPGQTDVFFDLLAQSGVNLTAEKRQATRHLYCNDEFRVFVAYDNSDVPTAWATMYVDAESGFLANAFTFPSFRGRGFHSALLSARISVANTLQLKNVFTDVELDSQSLRNCQRAGFSPLSTNRIWKRDP